ncbi:AAA family ATPase [Actinomadura macra]|uniref:AAA family ATPase n=1 Tax=Actinomadura macra TaxID=46164 RepID=UPI000A05ACF7|nr:AAA family ATPase [Actinomadura macra]
MAPRTRKPTGRVPWPLVLVEGGEKSGKSWAGAELSASPKVGRTFWVDLAEGAADEYGAIPGARYEVVIHDGSWPDIVGQIDEVRQVAAAEAAAGRPPVVLVIDSMTAEWDLLKDVADRKARARLARKGRTVPEGEEVQIDRDIWNDVNARHRRLMTTLMTFPGIVVMTARGKEVGAVDKNGNPIAGRKDYKVEGQKYLAYDASAWVRLSRESAPMVVGLRSVHSGVRPGVDQPVTAPKFSLEWLIFDVLKCEPAVAQPRDLRTAAPERTAEEIAAEALRPESGLARLRELAREANALDLAEVTVSDGQGNEGSLKALITFLGQSRAAAEGPATDAHHRRMHALWREAGDFEDRIDRLTYTGELVGRQITTSKELTGADAERVIAGVQRYIAQNTPPNEDGAAA